MRPSQYHYIKRMLVRNSYKKKKNNGCLSSLIYLYFAIIAFVLLLTFATGLVLAVGFIFLIVCVVALTIKIIAFIWKIITKQNNVKGNNDFSCMQTFKNMDAQEKLEHIKQLADIINTTTDEQEFEKSLSEIKTELQILSTYKDDVKFLKCTPEKDLERIIKNEHLTRRRFTERVQKSEKEEDKIYDKNWENILIPGLDYYFVESGMFVIKRGYASIGMLQRNFKIGFNRASLIMKQLEFLGVVGSEIGTKPRNVIVTTEEFQDIVIKNKNKDFSEKFPKNNIVKSDIDPDIERYAIMCNAYLKKKDRESTNEENDI